jgi:Flp pilus assembly pilin Flp
MNNPTGPYAPWTHSLAYLCSKQRPRRETKVDPKTHNTSSDEDGASMVEYALLIILIAIVAILGVQIAGQEVSNAFSTVAGGLATPN